MSRSYKKYPCWSAPNSRNGIHSGVHDYKKLANRKARQVWYWDTPSGGAYKRITDSWDIRDYKSVYYTKTRVIKEIEKAKKEIASGERWLQQYYRKAIYKYYYYSK